MKFLKEERNAYQYKGHTVIQTSSGYRIKDGNGAWVGGEFDTDRDAHEYIDGLKESFFSSYERVASKSVLDSDGFYTDYTWYKSDDGLNVFVFGDSEIYTPEQGNFDFETESDAEAQEWFDSYNGFEEDLVEGKDSDETHLKLSGNMIEIPIEDNSEVGELGHPIQQGIGDPRRKREVVSEATATLEKPLSNLNGTLSSVLLAHKDEVDTLFDKRAAVEFLDRIAPEVKNKSYLEKVKQEVMRGKRTPVEYFYNIILKGDGDGTEKGGKISKKAQINKWAKEGLNETWSRGDEVTLWWIDPKWSQTAPCYASCEYVGKARDGKYRFKSTTYGWEFLLDTVDMTVTTPQGKTFAVDNSSGWLKDVTTEGWVAKYVPEKGDAVTIIGNVYTDSRMEWQTDTDKFIGAKGVITYAGSRYSTFDSIEIELEDGTTVWTAHGYRPVEKNPLKESYNVQFYQIFKNPEKPTDNGKMIAQAGTEEEAKAKGDKLVGKGNYLIKAVCDDGKVRDVDLYSYFNESKPVTEEVSDPVYVASSIESLNSYCAGLGDACKKLRDGNMCSYRGYEVEFVDGEYNVFLLESLNEALNKGALATMCSSLIDAYGKLTLTSEQADKILASCGKEPTGKDATFDEILSVVQDVIAYAPLAAGTLVGIVEAIFDALMALATAGLIVLPIDGPVGETITAILAAIPVTVVVTAVMSIPSAIANRLILLARKALRKEDVEKVEDAAAKAGIDSEDKVESLREDVEDWSYSVYSDDELLVDELWCVSDALEYIHDNGGNIIKIVEDGSERIIWKDGKAVGTGFIGKAIDSEGNDVHFEDGEDVPTHAAPEPFNPRKWLYGEAAQNKPLYIIRDSQGNQLSAPNPDDDELWDRVASMEARGRRGLCVVVYTGKKESLNEWNEFSDDDVEDDLTHAAVYGGDSEYCKECGAVKKYDEDGFAYCPECCGELDEAYYINDEILRNKQDRLMLELEDQGYQEVDSRSQDGCYWTFFRKMVDGKGQWKAVFVDSVSGEGKIVDVTYGQARGYEPLSDMDALRKDLGNKLLLR